MTKPRMIIDLETQGLGTKPTILGVAWSFSGDYGEHHAGADEWFDLPEQRAILQQRLHEFIPVFHNAPFDVRVLREHGFEVPDFEDTMLLAHVVDPSHEEYGLNACLTRAGLDTKLEYAPPEGWDTAHWTDEMAAYALVDAEQTDKLYWSLRYELEEDPKALKHYETIERPYADVILEMESTGFTLDLEKLERVRQHLTRKAAGLERVIKGVAGYVPTPAKRYSNEALMGTYVAQEGGLIPAVTTYTTARSGGACWVKDRALVKRTNRDMKLFAKGEDYLPAKFEKSVVVYEHCPLVEFNPNSGAQIAERLQTLYGWEPTKFTKTGIPSTTGEILEDLDYPLAKMLTEYATTVKVLGSFIEPFSQKHQDGVLRGRFKQTGTRTGRLSSSDPNLQNVPTRSALGQHVRSLVIAPEGHVIVGIDLSNIEGRLLGEYLARIVGDFSMVEIFEAGTDFHQANADNWGVSRPDAKQLLYACVPMHAQALMGDGWRSYDDIAEGDLVMAWNPATGKNELTPVLEKVRYSNAPVTRWKHGHGFDVQSTPNHRWYGLQRKQVGHASTSLRYYKDVVFTTEEATTEHIIRRTAKAAPGPGVSLDHLLDKHVDDHLWPSLVMQMDETQRWLWFSANIATDGHKTKGSDSVQFSQNVDKQPGLYEGMVLAGYLLGYNVYQSERKENGIRVARFGIRQTTTMQNMEVTPEYDVCDVWCIRTEFGTWVMRQGDTITITGNTVYGAGPEKVGHGDKERGKKLMASLEKNAPGIFELKERIWEEARKRDGILHTLFGRRLVYSDIILDNAIETAKRLKKDKPDDYRDVSVKGLARSLVSRAERQIVNALLQGTAADVLKILTLEVRPQIHRANGMIAASVHDELLNYVPSDYAPWVRDQLTKAFTSDTMLKYAPITGDAAIGKSWKEVH